ncbi:VIT1/CCC1 transporter family protein [Paraburkholderia caribensis]|jgi:VIT1/CCC1 family predicted Fe2+/Mn2+ transporter|uniref:Rubrerythrin family protein n=1 Tax=Paraburkholderia caribensis TaxID=75105 RepID=A0A9Q6S7L8_9BURK|nr:VIT1/CCC1 transporter family protein [Paraburkholderia caribensis]MCO4882112.1 VIT1/CCC1 transporter family protein [Paraburkholderia caribensis]PTB28697.1 rubrerythrin family protein [Paraburkholderia caribensis]QLB66006.1 rubrerythrin family protein [Paraburkholderia caribensis]
MASRHELKRYRMNLADELDSAALYETLSRVEKDPQRRTLFAQLASAERVHANLWANKLHANGARVPPHRYSVKTHLMRGLIHTLGPKFVLPSLAAAEYADRDKYANQPDAAQLSKDEQHHAAVMQQMVADVKGQQALPSKGAQIAAAESWHRNVTSGNDLRAAVLGANDGLVSNFCLIMGVAGAGSGNKAILLTALAGLIAGACSMALGEWLSVTNARELARTQIAKEADEIEHTPEAEQHELALIFQSKGIDADEAKRVAAQIMRDKQNALDTLTREELGLDPAELGGNPWTAAGVSFCLFSLGAIFPAMPFLWTHGTPAIAQCVALSALGLAAVGVFTSLFNGRGAAFSAFRQIVIGLIAAAFTFGVGRLLGVSIS